MSLLFPSDIDYYIIADFLREIYYDLQFVFEKSFGTGEYEFSSGIEIRSDSKEIDYLLSA